MNKDQVNTFESLEAQLDSLYNEIQILVKKSPNDALNKFKLNLVNSLITRANLLLEQLNISKPFEDFSIFEVETLPSNSDVLFITSQYLACLEKIRADNINRKLGEWFWLVDGKQSEIKTSSPKKLSD